MRSMPKYFNMMVQTWNSVFFMFVTLGGAYLVYTASYLWGVICLALGIGGVYFCMKQAQAWSEVKKEDLPPMDRETLKEWIAGKRNALKPPEEK